MQNKTNVFAAVGALSAVSAFCSVSEADLHFLKDAVSTVGNREYYRERVHRVGGWWSFDVPNFTDDEFFAHFRVGRQEFGYLLEILDGVVKERTNASGNQRGLKRSLPLEQELAMYLMMVSSENLGYTKLGSMFGVARSTAHASVHNIADRFNDLQDEVIRFPTITELKGMAAKSKDRNGIPGATMKIDGTHVEIESPWGLESVKPWINRKGFPSLGYLIGCDFNRKIRLVCKPLPGSQPDTALYLESHLDELFKQIAEHTCDDGHQLYVIGDAIFALRRWLLKPYDQAELDRDPTGLRIVFNYYLSSERMDIECCFGILKGRFRIWMGRLKCGHELMAQNLLNSTFIVHNLLIDFYMEHRDQCIDTPESFYERYKQMRAERRQRREWDFRNPNAIQLAESENSRNPHLREGRVLRLEVEKYCLTVDVKRKKGRAFGNQHNFTTGYNSEDADSSVTSLSDVIDHASDDDSDSSENSEAN